MKALIVDDERPARLEMKRLLKVHPNVEIVGESSSSEEALRMIAKHSPDLLFLDVQIRSEIGLDILTDLAPPIPKVIITTAYDEYAVRAFAINALDYLLKPIEPARLAEALNRMIHPGVGKNPNLNGSGKFGESDRVFIHAEDRCWFLPLRDIRLLESEGNYTRIHFGAEKPLIYRTLVGLEERLPQGLFLRANRSQILNVIFIESLENWFSGNLKARLLGGAEVEISRRQSQFFRVRTSL
jgi:two-component system, LytTR family, response regulator